MAEIILVANPGSASRKYGLFRGDECLARIHFEEESAKVICSVETNNATQKNQVGISHVSFSATHLPSILKEHNLVKSAKDIEIIALRVVAPSSYFQTDRWLDAKAQETLRSLAPIAPLHIHATLQELNLLQKTFATARFAGISDSAFHITLEDVAASYAISPKEAQELDIKRFGYQGISAESVVAQLKKVEKLPARLVSCHLGSGSSVTAIKHGKSIDTTMGFSPLEGVVMATRSGSIDVAAALVLQESKDLSGSELLDYLNTNSGLAGVSGKSSDIRQLLELETSDPQADFALRLYVHKLQQAIAQMSASLGGMDALVFTGTVGERSAVIRQRVVHGLLYLGLGLNGDANNKPLEQAVGLISPPAHPVKICVIHADEESVMARRSKALA